MGAPPCMVNEGENQSQPVKLEWKSMEKRWKSTLEVYWTEWENMGNKTQLTGLMEMINFKCGIWAYNATSSIETQPSVETKYLDVLPETGDINWLYLTTQSLHRILQLLHLHQL